MTSDGDDPLPEDPISLGEAVDVARGKRPGRFRKPTNRMGCALPVLGFLVAAAMFAALIPAN